MRYVFIGVCVSLMVIGHPDDLPHCHTGWEWMCILPDDLHHLHMIFIVAEMYPALSSSSHVAVLPPGGGGRPAGGVGGQEEGRQGQTNLSTHHRLIIS